MTPDGRWVAFSSAAGNLGAPGPGVHIYLRDVLEGRTVTVSGRADGAAFEPALSADARRVAYTATRGGRSRVLVKDLATGATSVVAGPAGAGISFDPSISADGGRVAFASTIRNLAASRAAGPRSVYVRDLAGGRATLVSDGSPRKGHPH